MFILFSNCFRQAYAKNSAVTISSPKSLWTLLRSHIPWCCEFTQFSVNDTFNVTDILSIVSSSYLWHTTEATMIWPSLNWWNSRGVLAITFNDINFALKCGTFILSYYHVVSVAKFQI